MAFRLFFNIFPPHPRGHVHQVSILFCCICVLTSTTQTAPSWLPTLQKQGSLGEITIPGLKLETPEEERLIRILGRKEKILAKKEKKVNEAIALIQDKHEVW